MDELIVTNTQKPRSMFYFDDESKKRHYLAPISIISIRRPAIEASFLISIAISMIALRVDLGFR